MTISSTQKKDPLTQIQETLTMLKISNKPKEEEIPSMTTSIYCQLKESTRKAFTKLWIKKKIREVLEKL